MSYSAQEELQKAIYAKLAASAALLALSVKIYDTVPPDRVFPYITIGESQEIPDDADCIDGSEIYETLHIWARSDAHPGFPLPKQIGAAVRAALDKADLTMPHFALISIRRDGERYFRDPDGITSHGVLTFRALTEPAD